MYLHIYLCIVIYLYKVFVSKIDVQMFVLTYLN